MKNFKKHYIINYKEFKGKMDENIFETSTNCTVACHCGPGTLGVLFMTK